MTRNQPATGGTTFLVSDTLTYLPGRRVAPTPADAWDHGLAGLTLRMAAALSDRGATEGAVLLDSYATDRLSLPLDPAALESGAEDHPAVVELRDAGWRVASLRDWMILYTKGRPTLHVGVMPWINRERCPILTAGDYASIVDAFELWHRIMGVVYHGTTGVAGMSAVRQHATAGNRGKSQPPTWQPKETGPAEAYELDYYTPGGGRPAFRGTVPDEHTYLHGYDANKMYLSAYAQVPLCPWTLKHTRETDWSADLAGWWLIEPAEWNDPAMPDPLGYPREWGDGPKWATDAGRTVRWVTAPTMALLSQLREEGTHSGYVVLDSYTGPAKRVLRPVGERLRDLWQSLSTAAVPGAVDLPAREAIQAVAKLCYRETNGMLNSPNSRVKRPDWHYAVIAQSRANLWRRIRKVGEESGRYPAMIETDCLYYSSDLSDPHEAAPEGLTIGLGLGEFKVHKTLRLKG